MSKKTRGEEKLDESIFEPSKEEFVLIRKELEANPQIRVNGKLQPRIELVAQKRGLIKFDEYGNTVVKKPIEYTNLLKMHVKVAGQQRYEQEQDFLVHPEKKKEHNSKISEILQDMREKLMGKFKINE